MMIDLWNQNFQFLSDLFDAEEIRPEIMEDGSCYDGDKCSKGERTIQCTLPMSFLGGANQQVQFRMNNDGTVLFQTQDEYEERLGQLTSEDDLYNIVERYYSIVGHRINAKQRVKVRDFTFPVIDPRHWGQHILSANNMQSTSSSSSSSSADSAIVERVPQEQIFTVTHDHVAEKPGQLSVCHGEHLQFVRDNEDGWFVMRRVHNNENGNDNNPVMEESGLVPADLVHLPIK